MRTLWTGCPLFPLAPPDPPCQVTNTLSVTFSNQFHCADRIFSHQGIYQSLGKHLVCCHSAVVCWIWGMWWLCFAAEVERGGMLGRPGVPLVVGFPPRGVQMSRAVRSSVRSPSRGHCPDRPMNLEEVTDCLSSVVKPGTLVPLQLCFLSRSGMVQQNED